MHTYDAYFHKLSKKVPTLQIHMESPRQNLVYSYSTHHANQIFHSASIGKVFCAVLVMQAVEAALVTLDTAVAAILPLGSLDGLFVVRKVDYQKEVTLRQLLSHTSGINDYFDGKTHRHPRFIKGVMANKEHVYTPSELLDFTRQHQRAVSRPNTRFFYSDSGFVLLGMILEHVYQKPYARLLKEKIFTPLNMADTCLCFYDDQFDPTRLAPVLFKGIDMHLANSLSCDYAGGGLQTTGKDLARFLQGLFQDRLMKKSSRLSMMQAPHKFHGIMRYGLGLIEIKSHRIVPWMRGYPSLYGGLGSLSVHAFYDPLNADVYIINLGDASKMRLSFMALMKMVQWLNPRT